MKALEGCVNLQEEFSSIKKAYFKKILQCHPDKGGDAAVFRNVNTSFEVLRGLLDSHGIKSFYAAAFDYSVKDAFSSAWQDFSNMETPSYNYYEEAAAEEIPQSRMERAKSSRSTCTYKSKTRPCGAKIPIGEVRIGTWNAETGSYHRWVHLDCWRVPNRVWEGFPSPDSVDFTNKVKFGKALACMNQVLLCGFTELPDYQQEQVLCHVMNKENWAAKRKLKPAAKTGDNIEMKGKEALKMKEAALAATNSSSVSQPKAQLVPSNSSRERFIIPAPGKDGALAGSLARKTVVLTGTFPEVGGGSGLSLGKAKVKAMIESFGGKVTASVSGKTDILVVGKDPGYSKVSNAKSKPNCTMVSLQTLANVVYGHLLEDIAKPMTIESFSSGYNGYIKKHGRMVPIEETSSSDVASKRPKEEEANDSKRPAKKKKVVTEVIVEADTEEHAEKPRAAPRRKAADATKREADAIAVPPAAAAPKKKQAMKKAVAKKTKKTFSVSCDGCGVECTLRSFAVKGINPLDPELDFCPGCADGKGGVPQSNGIS
jgi:BRCT domain type II-containing protein